MRDNQFQRVEQDDLLILIYIFSLQNHLCICSCY
ncbi:unnamed protein product [Brassica oleracea var. botrytis]